MRALPPALVLLALSQSAYGLLRLDELTCATEPVSRTCIIHRIYQTWLALPKDAKGRDAMLAFNAIARTRNKDLQMARSEYYGIKSRSWKDVVLVTVPAVQGRLQDARKRRKDRLKHLAPWLEAHFHLAREELRFDKSKAAAKTLALLRKGVDRIKTDKRKLPQLLRLSYLQALARDQAATRQTLQQIDAILTGLPNEQARDLARLNLAQTYAAAGDKAKGLALVETALATLDRLPAPIQLRTRAIAAHMLAKLGETRRALALAIKVNSAALKQPPARRFILLRELYQANLGK